MPSQNISIDPIRLQKNIEIKEKLPLRYAALLAADIVSDFDEQLLSGVALWMDDKLTEDFGIEECKLKDIIEDTGADLFESLLMLNLQISHPDRIEKVLWVEKKERGIIDDWE